MSDILHFDCPHCGKPVSKQLLVWIQLNFIKPETKTAVFQFIVQNKDQMYWIGNVEIKENDYVTIRDNEPELIVQNLPGAIIMKAPIDGDYSKDKTQVYP